VKLNNLKIAPRLGIAVEVSLFGLCVAGALALYVVKEAMFDARVERLHAIVDRAGNIQSVAAGSNEINSHIGGVTTAAAATGTAATDVLSNVREFDIQSGTLRGAVDGFLAKVRAA
jgi:hypothetical protein